MSRILLLYLLLINLVGFVLYGVDKAKSKGRGRRIPERVRTNGHRERERQKPTGLGGEAPALCGGTDDVGLQRAMDCFAART